MKTPNIFSRATSELSQDAFLCWLLACSESDCVSLRNLGLDFIVFLYNSKKGDTNKIQRNQVTGLVKNEEHPYPWKQYLKTDVYFQAKIDEKTVSFIIEDKTETQMHSEQLKKYTEQIAKDNIAEDEVRNIYLKTGYIYDDERKKAEDQEYAVIGLKNFTEFLSEHAQSVENDIFKDYMDYVTDRGKRMDRVWEEAKDFYEDVFEYHEIFQHKHVQWEFMRVLQNVVKEVLDEKKEKLWNVEKENEGVPIRGVNRGGDPWTQFYWYGIKGKYQNSEITEYIFWRVDGWYSLRLRHGVWPGKGGVYDGFDEKRKERLKLFREIFKEEGEEIFKDALVFPSGRTGQESTIGEIQFNSPANSVQKVFKRLPEFKRNFIQRIPI